MAGSCRKFKVRGVTRRFCGSPALTPPPLPQAHPPEEDATCPTLAPTQPLLLGCLAMASLPSKAKSAFWALAT